MTPYKRKNLQRSLADYISQFDVENIELTVQNGADVDSIVTSDGLTALHLSAEVLPEADCLTVAQILLSHGANPNIQNKAGESSVHTAASKGYTKFLSLLLVNGGDPLLGDIRGRSPVDFAFHNNHTETYHLLNEVLDSENYESSSEQVPNVVISLVKEEIEVLDVPDAHKPCTQEFSCGSNQPFMKENNSNASRFSNCTDQNDNEDQDRSIATEESSYSCKTVFDEAALHANKSKDSGGRNFASNLDGRYNKRYFEYLKKELGCYSDSDSDNTLLELQKCLERNLSMGCNSLQLDRSVNECNFDSCLEYSYDTFNIAQSPIDITLDEYFDSFFTFDGTYIPECDKMCNKKSHAHSLQDTQNVTGNKKYDRRVNDDQQIVKESINNLNDTSVFHVSKLGEEILCGNVSINSTSPLNSIKPDCCTSFQLLKAPKKQTRYKSCGVDSDVIFDIHESDQNCIRNLEDESRSLLYNSDLMKFDHTADTIDANETAPHNMTKPDCCSSFHLLKAPMKKKSYDDVLPISNNCNDLEKRPSKIIQCLIPKEYDNLTNDVSPSKREILGNEKCLESTSEYGTAKSSGSKGCTNQFLVSLVKEYLYEDLEEGVSLIERRRPASASVNSFMATGTSVTTGTLTKVAASGKCSLAQGEDVPDSAQKDKSFDSVGTLTDSVKCLSGESLRERLKKMGFTPGPILPSTERIYQRHLMRMQKNPDKTLEICQNDVAKYSRELKSALENPSLIDISTCSYLEQSMSSPFCSPDPRRHWRDGTNKTCFNYLLLDPRITKDLPLRGVMMEEDERFKCFVSAVFYIGKGTRYRPYYHLYEAFKLKEKETQKSKKAKRIQEIWSEGVGVVSLHVFQNTIPVEAWTREAAMISAIGLGNICNTIKGTFYGVASTWKGSEQRHLGSHLLRRALNIFMHEGERQLRPSDVTIPVWMKKKAK